MPVDVLPFRCVYTEPFYFKGIYFEMVYVRPFFFFLRTCTYVCTAFSSISVSSAPITKTISPCTQDHFDITNTVHYVMAPY